MDTPTPDLSKVNQRLISNPYGYPIFSDWIHTNLNVFNYPQDYHPEQNIIKQLTTTTHHLVIAYIQFPTQQPKSQHFDDPTFFWLKVTPGTEEDFKTMESNIDLSYGKDPHRVTKLYLNPTLEEFKVKSLEFYVKDKPRNQSSIKKEVRRCYHFIADSFPTEKLTPLLNSIPMDDIMKQIGTHGVLIIDCDNAASLYSKYEKAIIDMRDHGYSDNVFAFFSCGEDEKNPRSPGLPSDLFTSCLNSPGKIALLWHSSHYYCFKTGPLLPIHLDDLSQASPELIQTVDSILRGYVEAMASSVMSHYDFIKCFHSDEFVARSVCGFVMAQKILDFFNIHPVSDPPLPDFKDNPHWQIFSLQLDEALTKFREPQKNFELTRFLQYDLTTVSLLLNCDTDELNYLPYISILHLILQDDHLREQGLQFLCKFLDKNLKTNEIAWLFPLIDPMVKFLSELTDITDKNAVYKDPNPYLLMCIAKSVLYAPQCRKNFITLIDTVFIRKRLLHLCLKPDYALPVTILITSFFHPFINVDDRTRIHEIALRLIKTPWKEYVGQMVDVSPDVAAWTLLFISLTAMDINEDVIVQRVFKIVCKCIHHDSPIVRACALQAIAPFAHFNMEMAVYNQCHSLLNDLSCIVRSQLICSLSYIYHICYVKQEKEDQKTILKLITQDAQILAADTFLYISQKAEQFLKTFYVIPSYLFENLTMQFILGQTAELVEHKTNKLELACDKTFPLKPDVMTFSDPVSFKKSVLLEQAGQVSSNLCIPNQSTLLFGTSNGSLGLVPLRQPVQQKTMCKLAPQAITYITSPIEDLAVVSDILGNVYSLKFSPQTKLFQTVSTFRPYAEKMSITQISCSAQSKLMALLTKGMDNVTLIDLDSEKLMGCIKPTENVPKSVRVLDNMRDTVMVCSNKVELFDVRESLTKPFYEIKTEKPIFDCQFVGINYDLAIAFNNCTLLSGNIRVSPDLFRFVQHNPATNSEFASSISKIETCTFATHPSSLLCAFGTNRGASIFNLSTDVGFYHPTVTSSIFSSERLHPITQVVFHPTRQFMVGLQDGQDLIAFTEA